MRNDNVRFDAIKRLFNAPDGETAVMPDGEVIYAWGLIGEDGQPVNLSDLSDGEILAAYHVHLDWNGSVVNG